MRKAFVNGTLVLPSSLSPHSGLLVEDGRILGLLTPGTPCPEEVETVDLHGAYLAPGFIDMHLHGGGGYDFLDDSDEAFLGAVSSHLKHGTTSLCPTTLTCPDEELFTFFDRYRRLRCKAPANLLGIHLEGPYFNALQAGAQDPKYLRLPLKEHYEKLLEQKDIVARISAAPELEGAMEMAEAFRKEGILVAVGHSDATYQVMTEAVAHGFSHVTHLYSGMSSLHREKAYRVLGVVESAYLLDSMTVEIIADGKHLPKELLEFIVRFIGKDRLSLITDSSRGAGLPDGTEIILGSRQNGQQCFIEDGVAIMPDHLAFAGSVCTSDRAVRTMYQEVGLPLWEAVGMMTRNPAKVLGLKTKGILAPGYDADLVVFDKDIHVSHVLVGGNEILLD